MLVLVHFVIGFWILIRVSDKLKEQKLISNNAMTKIGTAFLATIVFCYYILRFSHWLLIVLIYMQPIFLVLYNKLRLYWLKTQFENQILSFLSNTILYLKAGSSFQNSISRSKIMFNVHFQNQMDKLLNFVAFSQHNSEVFKCTRLRLVAQEFSAIEKHPSESLKRLENLRIRIRILEEFRRRSGQSMYQLRVQCLVTVAMYFACFVYVGSVYGFYNYVSTFGFSLCWIFLGSLWMFKMGNKIKWST